MLNRKNIKPKTIENLFQEHTNLILAGVDEKISKVEGSLNKRIEGIDKKFDTKFKETDQLIGNQTIIILSAVEEKILKSEERTSKKSRS